MNKEIKEMAEILDTVYDNQVDHDAYEDRIETATALYNEGYRKQSDVAREFAERLYREIYNIVDTVSTVQLNNYTKDYIRKPCVVSAIAVVAKEFGVEVE